MYDGGGNELSALAILDDDAGLGAHPDRRRQHNAAAKQTTRSRRRRRSSAAWCVPPCLILHDGVAGRSVDVCGLAEASSTSRDACRRSPSLSRRVTRRRRTSQNAIVHADWAKD